MAKIILSPGEKFEHLHSSESDTALLEGEVEFHIGEKVFNLIKGEKISVAANQAHWMINIGNTEAVINCGGHAAGGIN